MRRAAQITHAFIGQCTVLVLFAAAAGFILAGTTASPAQEVPVLVYHRFDPAHAGSTTVRTSVFEGQLIWLTEHGYRVVPLSEAVDMMRGRGSLEGPRNVVITVDDGHRSVYSELFPLIQRYRIPVTLFIYPSAISHASYALTWEQLHTMQKSGLVDIESHTYWHPNFNRERARLSPEAYQKFVAFQLERSKSVLEEKFGIKVMMLAWPYGIYDAELEKAASDAGYSEAFAYSGGPAHPGCDLLAIPRIPVSDADQGERFAALLAGKQKSTAGAE